MYSIPKLALKRIRYTFCLSRLEMSLYFTTNYDRKKKHIKASKFKIGGENDINLQLIQHDKLYDRTLQFSNKIKQKGNNFKLLSSNCFIYRPAHDRQSKISIIYMEIQMCLVYLKKAHIYCYYLSPAEKLTRIYIGWDLIYRHPHRGLWNLSSRWNQSACQISSSSLPQTLQILPSKIGNVAKFTFSKIVQDMAILLVTWKAKQQLTCWNWSIEIGLLCSEIFCRALQSFNRLAGICKTRERESIRWFHKYYISTYIYITK